MGFINYIMLGTGVLVALVLFVKAATALVLHVRALHWSLCAPWSELSRNDDDSASTADPPNDAANID
jgi:hypothetical protein